jgi:DNA-binding transcriptional LysR family regulator
MRSGQLMCALPKGHPLCEKKVIEFHDLRSVNLISYPRFSPIGQIVDDAFHDANETQQINIEVRFCFTACTLVNAGACVAIVDEFTATMANQENVEIRPLQTNKKVTVSLIYPYDKPLSRLARTFLDDYLWQCYKAPDEKTPPP